LNEPFFIGSCTMKSTFTPCLDHAEWRTLYRAAILETNKNVIPHMVSEAEKAVISRRRQLFGTMGTLEEKEALEDALYALQAFRTACKHRSSQSIFPVGRFAS
jgi:hypothetical protein